MKTLFTVVRRTALIAGLLFVAVYGYSNPQPTLTQVWDQSTELQVQFKTLSN